MTLEEIAALLRPMADHARNMRRVEPDQPVVLTGVRNHSISARDALNVIVALEALEALAGAKDEQAAKDHRSTDTSRPQGSSAGGRRRIAGAKSKAR